ncbi:hypothetical protein [Xanthomonas campestris]|uniref:hypothetical protein n=1 Tax=Xanthomonas campestris TaxID=339 RepID=UPI0011C07540|nr:hypothetical protein [Xanthomonas campestris]MEA9748798.1 hypothetical protein [Xanthomonas campestris pv. raphani]MEA9759580.1 hypothetical protein [Xanthomonas campestris pv. raphani]MEA9845884.1 hypothetical protein [Xanthomonas campestris pv. raphani]MEA9850131.1 hypothetical protein [Xanthomonas campestris pv. raphani]MEA9906763.1 hypothetical protein [Xanthomonas campestris pv. raphani]
MPRDLWPPNADTFTICSLLQLMPSSHRSVLSVNWYCIARTSLLLTLVAAIALAAKPATWYLAGLHEQPAPVQQAVVLSAQDEIQIWKAVADQRYPVYLSEAELEQPFAKGKRRPVMLLDRSTQTCIEDRAQHGCYSSLDQGLLSDSADAFVSKQARQALLLANEAQVDVRLPDSTYVRGASTAHVDALLIDINWPAFYKAFPGTAGYLQLSVPVSVNGAAHSLVYAEQRCHGRCGTGMLYLLARAGNGWKITKRFEVWVS